MSPYLTTQLTLNVRTAPSPFALSLNQGQLKLINKLTARPQILQKERQCSRVFTDKVN